MIPAIKLGQTVTDWGFEHFKSQEHIPSRLRPVRIVCGNQGVAMGTLVLDSKNKPRTVISAAHCFPASEVAQEYFYVEFNYEGKKVLRPLGPPKRLSKFGGYDYPVSCDVSANPVSHKGLSLKPFQVGTQVQYATLREPKEVFFLLNGSPIVFTEVIVFPGEEGRYLCEEAAVPGMSGSGAFDRENTLHVLAQSASDSVKRGDQQVTFWMPAVSFK